MTDKLVALQFKDEQGFARGLEALEARSEIPYSLPGNRNIALPTSALGWFVAELRRLSVKFEEIPVVDASDLPEGKADRIRRSARASSPRMLIRVRNAERLAQLLQLLIRTDCPFVYLGSEEGIVVRYEDWTRFVPDQSMFEGFEHRAVSQITLDLLAIRGKPHLAEFLGM
ncbi:hypothetical protein C4552_02350 [Candidatus Parcubacteria bacterium]|nr:MAG: hypothetical protein C4552_02350 [Candidatus Parcubacteria bacterium]